MAPQILDELKKILERHKQERVCVLGTICCGKTTLLRQIPGCVDLDDVFWPRLTEEEATFISARLGHRRLATRSTDLSTKRSR